MQLPLQLLDAVMYASILAQADSATKWVAPLILVVVILAVIAISFASRGDADADAPPRVEEPKDPEKPSRGGPSTDVGDMKDNVDLARVEKILKKHPDDWTVAERKIINLAKKADDDLSDRITAVEHTAAARDEHTSLEEESGEEDSSVEEVSDASEDVADEAGDADDGGDEVEEKAPVAAASADDGQTSMADGLQKTRGGFAEAFAGIFRGKKEIDEDLQDHIEEFLYTSDIGSKAATRVLKAIQTKMRDDLKDDPAAVWEFVRAYITDMLVEREGKLDVSAHSPYVMLVIGVNGAGKTTTIGKLASKYKRQGKSVLLVAGDTFRAAAVEQLEVWADRVDVPLHKGESEADPASVVYDGIERGVEEGVDVIICDTSGRLHTNANLMDELRKIQRVSGKAFDGAPHETVLVLDANMGQNAISQAKTFGEALGITGIVLTKLDGTARGGVILGIGEELDVPVRYIGIGEGIKDLRDFDAEEFAEALFL
jgi:fused signal recognition particle receptor